MACEGKIEAILGIADALKPSSAQAVKALHKLGLEVAMLTGDNRATAESIAQSAGITRVFAEVRPHQKAAQIQALQGEGKIVAMVGDLQGIVTAIKLSRATMRNIRENLFFAFIYNIAGIPLAAGILFPIFGWLLNPIIAGAAMAFSSVSVVSNALRLRNFKPKSIA
jgi:Cu+-exporting ATPase